jgi:predicted transcriptional regulator
MSTISLRLPDSLHKQVRKLAQQESVSINQLITLALAEKLSALVTEEYLDQRAERGHRKKFERAMAKIPKVKPEEHDRLPA